MLPSFNPQFTLLPGLHVSELESQTPVREGLPPTYRMRADAHYVDLIESRVTHASRPSSASVHPQESTERPPEFADPTLHAGRDLAQSLATLTSCAALLSDAPSDLSRAVVGDLMKAEAWRASSLVLATRAVRKELSITRSAISVSGVLDKLTLGFQSERRVRAVALDARSAMPYGSVVVGDEQMVSGALSWALLSSVALVTGVADACLTVSAAGDAGNRVTFAVSQPTVTPPPIWQARAFDATWTDRPGGVPALLWMLALQETAQAHGGTVRVERSDRGTSIAFALPISV